MDESGTRPVDYDHRAHAHAHSVEGALHALRLIFEEEKPLTVLDIGCGMGTWLRAALELGASEVLGVDGVDLPSDLLLVPKDRVIVRDLGEPLELGRRFDLVLCLETAEHLEPEYGATIIDSIIAHGDRILFSAAVPGQHGTHHVNCRWPDYWQSLFNARGFSCDDSIRWRLWDDPLVEPWYRQNLMAAVRDPANAGHEPRIKSVLHPEVVLDEKSFLEPKLKAIEAGSLPAAWYITTPLNAAIAKIRAKVRGQ